MQQASGQADHQAQPSASLPRSNPGPIAIGVMVLIGIALLVAHYSFDWRLSITSSLGVV